MGRAYVGISGWTYAGWRGVFYPPKLPHRSELQYASRQLNAIEINGTFYRMQRPENFTQWRTETPKDFRFAVKGSRFITHMKQLRDVRTPLANFFHAVTTTAVTGRASYHTETDRRIRHAVEVRHPSFFADAFLNLLRAHDAALVFSDAAADWPYAEDVTADFVYIRLHGAEELYASGYDDEALDEWARRARLWLAGSEPPDARRAGSRLARRRNGRDLYVFFDNDAKVRAPFDAMGLADRLGLSWRKRHAG